MRWARTFRCPRKGSQHPHSAVLGGGGYTRALWMVLVLISTLFMVPAGFAAASKDWTHLTDCTYMTNRFHHGDSFHVWTGDKECIFRLYFVDCAKTDKQFGRYQQRAEYWGIPDEKV